MKNRLLTLGLLVGGLILASCGGNNSQTQEKEKSFTVIWKNYDGTVLEVDNDVKEGTLPTYDGATPVKAEDEYFTYTWNGWKPEVYAVDKDETYTATFTSNDKIPYLSVSEAIVMAHQAGEEGTTEKQYVKGIVKNITNSTFGEMYITDGTNDLYIYGVYSSDGSLRYCDLEEKPYTDDEVFLYGYLKTYKDAPEMGQSWLIRMVSHQGEADVNDYQEMNIASARNADKGSKVLIQGVVATITYANGQIPSGIYLVDDTSSIYVYNPEIAGRVKVGEEIKVAGTRDNYILEGEVQYAEQFGYQGSIQLTDAIFVESISQNKDYLNKSWIKETTMKKLMETPLTDNVTTEIHKVTAIVNKAPGSGFTNYYIDDLDNETGSYVYTLCNGNDFGYLDKYDGKICTVYVAIHNAKSTKTGIVYRLMPIRVFEIEDFSMSDENIAKFALEYYGARQFKKEYNSDPELELLTSVNNEYIPFENVALSYETDNNIVTFVDEDGKLVMHIAKEDGDVNLTLTAQYKGKTEKLVVSFKVVTVDAPDTTPIKDAIELEDGTTIVVRGIVMSSLVNQTGFYLNDGTGVIAVRTTKETIGNIAIGNDVVMEGTRTHVVKDGSSNKGQSCIDNATLVANFLGQHDYDKSTFITDLTFEQIFENKNKQATVDLTCNVYVASCYLRKNVGSYSTNYYLSNESHDKEFYLYAGSGGQYADFDAFSDGRLITVEFMLCDWNTKNEYRACIVSATDGETTVLNTLNFK